MWQQTAEPGAKKQSRESNLVDPKSETDRLFSTFAQMVLETNRTRARSRK